MRNPRSHARGPEHPPPWQSAPAVVEAPALEHPPSCDACEARLPSDAFFCGGCGAPRYEDPRLGQVVLGRYRLVEALGAGGMGAVYRAEQRVGRFTRSVAVKILHADLVAAPSIRARFERECEIVIELTHPNTIKFYDFGALDDGSLAIVMELVEGECLADRMARGPLPADEAFHVAREIGASLAEAHEHGIVHRDLKPENVLLYDRPGARVGVKVLDFGVAKRLPADGEADPSAISFRGEVLGTPAYMSPEQIAGIDADARSDLYALGVLVYEMLTGALPFAPADCLVEWADRHLHEPPIPLEARPAGAAVDPATRQVIMRCLAKDARDRPASATELAEALRAATARVCVVEHAVERARADTVDAAAPGVDPADGPFERSTRPHATPMLDAAEPVELPTLPRARRGWLGAFAAAVLAGFVATGAALASGGGAPSTARPSLEKHAPEAMIAACEPHDDPGC